MTKRMLVDATHPEETRVAIVDGNWLNDFDFERASKKQLKGNIYLAKVIRIEPSLQAAFVEYGGNRHGFLPFTEIHPDYFRIPMADRPHGEEAPDDIEAEDDVESAGETEAEADNIEAYVAEANAAAQVAAEHDEHAHDDHEHHHDEAPLEVAAEAPDYEAAPVAENSNPSYAPIENAAPSFAVEAPNELGLITDFGNAAIMDASLDAGMAAPVQLEVVGGEVAEEIRPPRIHRPRYKIQEVVKRRQVMLIQVVKEERGNKGAALTSFLSLAGRYCVLMPNTDHGGGVSRKITSHQDRRRMKEILDQLEIPEGMAVILRTAGMEQEVAEIQRDLEYLLRLWNNIREQTLQSTAPALIYEEANLIKRSMRDMYAPDLSEILVAGSRGHQLAVDFMSTIMPDQLDKVKLYEDTVPLFFRYNVEKQIDQLYNPTVQLRSGGYIVINPTEALVSIDVNSGRATRERHIEGTALKTNLEAADEIARQLRLRDLAGLVVIDFIDMEDGRNNAAVERRMKEAMRVDRARLQIGRISPFGLLELSRQRLHPSLMEINFEKCPHCAGLGLVRSVDSAAISILRMIEEEGIRQGSSELVLHVPTSVALYILNQKRSALSEIEARYNLQVLLHSDDALVPPSYKLERVKPNGERVLAPAVNSDQVLANIERPPAPTYSNDDASGDGEASEGRSENREGQNREGQRDGRGRRGGGRFGNRDRNERGGRNRGGERGDRNQDRNQPRNQQPYAASPDQPQIESIPSDMAPAETQDSVGNAIETIGGAHTGTHTQPNGQTPNGQNGEQRRAGRRRGRRGGRNRHNGERGPQDPNRPPREARDPNQPHQPREHNRDNRPPREPRQNNRPDNRQDNWNREPVAVNAPPHAPVSIHDIDTTPRPVGESRSPSASHNYEVVDQSSDKPKGGWWRKLTGQ